MPPPSPIRLAALGGEFAVNPVLALARPEILSLKPYSHAAWLPSLTRLHANEAPWRPAGDASAARAQSLPGAAARRADRTSRRALRRACGPRCLRRTAAMRPSMLLSRIYLRAGADAILQCDADLWDVSSGRAHSRRGRDRGAARARARLEPGSRAAARRMAAAGEARVPVLAQQSDRQPARRRRAGDRSAARSTAKPSS